MTLGERAVGIELRGCAKTFEGGNRALQPIDLSIGAGETLVLLGPSGCGKTTTLRLIAGLERPDPGGRVLFGDSDVTALPIEQRHVGMVFQSYALFPNMTVAGNIGYGLKIRRLSVAEIDARVGEMLQMMRIEALAPRRVDQLSGGQRQRVALARALAVRPRALLLDEPLTALDARLRDTLRAEIDALLRRLHITTVYVTHDQAEAMALGDRVAVMDHGRIAQIGTPREIYRRPASRFVAEFIGTMNRLAGRWDGDSFLCAAGRIAGAAGRIPRTAAGSEAVEIMFRPEHVHVVDEGEPADDGLVGTVSSVLFHGDRTRLLVDVENPRALVVDSAAHREYHRGERLRLRVDPGGVFAWPGE